MVGGSYKDQDVEGTLALLDRSLCYALSPLPEKRRAGLFSQLNESSLLYCGGRKSLLEINTECWTYTKDSWEAIEPLPRAIAGAASLGLGNKVWVFGVQKFCWCSSNCFLVFWNLFWNFQPETKDPSQPKLTPLPNKIGEQVETKTTFTGKSKFAW